MNHTPGLTLGLPEHWIFSFGGYGTLDIVVWVVVEHWILWLPNRLTLYIEVFAIDNVQCHGLIGPHHQII